VNAKRFYHSSDLGVHWRGLRLKCSAHLADEFERMIVYPPPMSNAARQRKFQESHPGYDRRRKAHQRGMEKRAMMLAQMELRLKLATQLQANAPATTANIPTEKPILMLTAPVKDPVMIAISAMSLLQKCEKATEPLPVAGL
jgi:hypothetical protein